MNRNIRLLRGALLLLFIALVNIGFSQVNGYGYYVDVTINSSNVEGSGSHSDFPVLVDLTDVALKGVGNGGQVFSSDGYDIIFTDVSNTVTLSHQIEYYLAFSGSYKAWVKIPSLSATSNTVVRMHFGKNGISTNPSTSDTWSNGFTSVWHLNQDYLDSKGSNDGTSTGTSNTFGKIYDSELFNSSTDKIDVGNFDVSGSALTISSWFKASDFITSDGRIISKSTSSNSSDHYFMMSTTNSSGYKLRSRIKTGPSNTTYELVASSGVLSTDTWYYGTMVYNGSTMKLFLDKTEVGSMTVSSPLNTNSSVPVYIGNNPNTAKPFSGRIDEVRIANVARSQDWIKTEYNNQNSPSTFQTMGTVTAAITGGGAGTGYNGVCTITIDGTKVSGTSSHTDFPIYIDVTENHLKSVSNGGMIENANAYDITFTNSSNTTALDFQLESYNASTGNIKAWVRIPSLSATSNTAIKLFYGKSGVITDPSTTGTWSSDYRGVWHFDGSIDDNTSNANLGTNNSSTTATGILGSGRYFDGVDDYIDYPNSTSLNLTGNKITMHAWVKAPVPASVDAPFMHKGSSTNQEQYMLGIDGGTTTNNINTRVTTADGHFRDDGGVIPNNVWTHVVYVYDGSLATNQKKVYVDGVLVAEHAATGNMLSTTSAMRMGMRFDGRKFKGTLDELRISDEAKSTDWIETEYKNQSSPSTFYSLTCGTTTAVAIGFADTCTLTINSSKVSGSSDLTDFPMYVDLTSTSLKTTANGGSIQNANGYDIAFTDALNSTSYDFQIESYDGINGTLKGWVRIPSLSVSNDQEVKLFYGKSGISTDPSTTGVWDNGYQGIWHFNGNIDDGTVNSNNGTNSGSASSTGRLGSGRSFNGTSDYITVPHSSSLDITGNTITLEAWVKAPTPNGDDSPFIHKGSSVNHEKYMLGIDGAGTTNNVNTRVYTYDSGLVRHDDGVIPNNVWTHVAMVYDGNLGSNQKQVYINGVLVASHSVTGNIYSTSANVQFGKRADARFFEGVLDELRISDIGRSADWIKTEYNNQNNPSAFYTYDCDDNYQGPTTNCGQKITFVGKGSQGLSSVTLNIPDVHNVDSIRVETVVKNSARPSSITYSSSVESITTSDFEQAINGNSNTGSFHAIMQPASSITITPADNTSHAHSAVAYIYRSDLLYESKTYFEILKVYNYHNSYTKVFSITPTTGVRNIHLTIPVSELNPDARKVEITITAGPVSRTISAFTENLGESLRIFRITLEDVPGNVDEVTVTTNSPLSDGDSFIAGNILVDIPCVGTPGSIMAEDDYKKTQIDTPCDINVLQNDIDPDNNLDYTSVTVTGLVSPTNGIVSNVNPTNGVITYTPNPGFSGVDSFEYMVCDKSLLCDVAWVYITIDECGETYVNPAISGTADVLLASVPSGLAAMQNVLGVVDYNGAPIHTDGDYLKVDLTDEVPSNEYLYFTWRLRESVTGTAKMVIYTSNDDINYFMHSSYPSTSSNSYTSFSIKLAKYTRYVKVTKSGSLTGSSIDFDVDAIQYTFYPGCEKDSDNDSIPDIIDIDDDDDGILDVVESYNGEDPSGDHDGDDILNFEDVNYPGFVDTNNDGTNDNFDYDMDGVSDHLDLDSDNDGVFDNIEAQTTIDFTNIVYVDIDKDGLMDTYDADLTGPDNSIGIIRNDHEQDGQFDVHDSDTDDDNIADWIEAFDQNNDTLPYEELTVLGNNFLERSGGLNYYSMTQDDDNNGILDWMEPCSSGASLPAFLDINCTSTYRDTDGDGLVDLLDSDDFGDPQTQPELPIGVNDKKWRDEFKDIGPLPVELLSFTGELVEENNVQLIWQTASEENNEYYTVKKSDNGIDYSFLTEVTAKGNSNVLSQYVTYDYNLSSGSYYYQLSQTDYDGSTKVVGVTTVKVGNTSNALEIIKWYLNGGNLNLTVSGTKKEAIILSIYSSTGQLIHHEEVQSLDDVQKLRVNMNHLDQGIYLLRLNNQEESVSLKFFFSE